MILIGDIGATKAYLAAFSRHRERPELVHQAVLKSRDFSSAEELISNFIKEVRKPISQAFIAVAAVLKDGHVQFLNLGWETSEAELKNLLGMRSVKFINDLVAMGNGIPLLHRDELFVLHQGIVSHEGPIAIIAPGTGLGQAYLVWGNHGYHVFPSEGGHNDFSPNDSTEIELLKFLQRKYGHVSIERVCSGQGIANIFYFLIEEGYYPEPDWLKDLDKTKDPVPSILEYGSKNISALCVETLRIFVSILGAEAGNMALKFFATGGVYIGGGLITRLYPDIYRNVFLNRFLNKGRATSLMESFPVRIITNPKIALLGAIRTASLANRWLEDFDTHII
ncbi:MAG: glucokinase [Bacteroidales bacterium]|nr:glucokinase [Bacteroidales bacterium]